MEMEENEKDGKKGEEEEGAGEEFEYEVFVIEDQMIVEQELPSKNFIPPDPQPAKALPSDGSASNTQHTGGLGIAPPPPLLFFVFSPSLTISLALFPHLPRKILFPLLLFPSTRHISS